MDAIDVKVREAGAVSTRAVYLAVGIDETRHKWLHNTTLNIVAHDTKLYASEDILIVGHYVPLAVASAMLKSGTLYQLPENGTQNQLKDLLKGRMPPN